MDNNITENNQTKELTEIELRQQVMDLQSKNEELTKNFNTVNDQIKLKEETINTLNKSIADLKQTNYDLFIKVSNPLDQSIVTNHTKPIEDQKVETKSLDQIASILGGSI